MKNKFFIPICAAGEKAAATGINIAQKANADRIRNCELCPQCRNED